MRSEGEEAEELTLQRMKTTRSSGKPSKRSDSSAFVLCGGGGVVFCFFLICFGLVFLCVCFKHAKANMGLDGRKSKS